MENDDFLRLLSHDAILSFNEAFPELIDNEKYYKDYSRKITNPDKKGIRSLLNHLVEDLLYVRVPPEKIEDEYSEFIDYLSHFERIDFITLNHDTLLEYLIQDYLGIPYSDGFSTEKSVLRSLEGNPIKVFNGIFDQSINVIKLHGSVDTYNYEIADEKGAIAMLTGEYIYFKTNDYHDKQRPMRHDPKSGKRIQSFHGDIDPNFIIGTNKEALIKDREMYHSMYNECEHRLMDCRTMLIIGYSFRDDHVNKLIQLSIEESKYLELIVHVNPGMRFPLQADRVKALNETEYYGLLDTL